MPAFNGILQAADGQLCLAGCFRVIPEIGICGLMLKFLQFFLLVS
jgi:hypothetical protein